MAAEVDDKEENTKKMTVFVAVPRPRHPLCAPDDLKVVALEVSSGDTVASVKVTLHHMEGIPPRRQRLVFACSALPDDDDTTLADHGVADSSTIQLVETQMQVFVYTLSCGAITFSGVESSDTVESFRLRVQEREGIRPRQQRLIYGGKQMEDGHTLADYGVGYLSTINLRARRVSVRLRVVELDIEVTDTVGRIKERVEEAEGVPVACQSISYCAKELDDGHALALDGRALEWVNIVCQRHEKGDTTKTTNKQGDAPMVVETETVKRRADVEVRVPSGSPSASI